MSRSAPRTRSSRSSAASRRVGVGGDGARRLAERGEEDGGDEVDRVGADDAFGGEVGEDLGEGPIGVAQLDRTPRLGSDDARRVDEDDALDIGGGAGVDQAGEGGARPRPRVGAVGGEGGGEQLALDLLGGGDEQRLLVGEVVVDRPRRHPRRGGDRAEPGASKPSRPKRRRAARTMAARVASRLASRRKIMAVVIIPLSDIIILC